jgi:hypothetical protein
MLSSYLTPKKEQDVRKTKPAQKRKLIPAFFPPEIRNASIFWT